MTKKDAGKSQTYTFQAEVSQLLEILTHSLYTHRDVFIRELISNATDALDKARFKDVSGESISDSDLPLEIKIELDEKNKLFTISDTGIGMTDKELVENIGTIARSGTSEFIKQLAKDNQENVNMIGKFGVGFYSVFMAGVNVQITTKSADPEAKAYIWTSDGKGSFEIEEGPEDTKRGTSIKVFLRDDAKEFSEELRIKSIIEKYSNFVPFPIYVGKEQINKQSAIWREPKSSIKKEQYTEFYKFIGHHSDEPLTWLHFSADVPIQFHTLFFIPKTNMELLGFGKEEEGVHLFVKRVMVDAHAKDVLPPYLRFIQGVLESDDLPLNISRETLQENPYLLKIKNTVVSKMLSHLADWSEKEPDAYKEFWNQHGRILKEGYNDYANKDKIAELFRFNSSNSEDDKELISLSAYVDNMHEKQEEIYFLSGSSRASLENNPAMEIFKSKGIEVLFCFDPIDEFVLPGLLTYKEKHFISADQVDLAKLDNIPSTESDSNKDEDKPDLKEVDQLARRIKDILGDKVENVMISNRLVNSPAVLVGKDKGMSSQMEKIMHMMNQEAPLPSKVMEINAKHPLIQQMLTIYQKNPNDEMLTKMASNLFVSVKLLDGTVDDPQQMANTIQDILTETSKLYTSKS